MKSYSSREYNYFDDDDEIERQIQLEAQKQSRKSKLSVSDEDDDEYSGRRRRRKKKEHPFLRRIVYTTIAFLVLVLTVLLAVYLFADTIDTNKAKLDEFNKDASSVCTDYIKRYGPIKWEPLDSSVYGENQAKLTGLCYARQMDFNNDGSDELMLCYYDNSSYHLHIWGYNRDGKFAPLYKGMANSTKKAKDGAWVTFYHNNDIYYICSLDEADNEKMELLELKGYEFKTVKTLKYDLDNNMFGDAKPLNQADFETIKLLGFRESKGEVLIDLVTKNIDAFGDSSLTKLNSKKSEDQLKREAYWDIINSRLEKFGEPEVKDEDGVKYIDGVAIIRLIDFDGDGNDELFLVYRKEEQRSGYNSYDGSHYIYYEPVYTMEVYNWNGTVAKRIFNRDSISGYFNDSNVKYVCLTKGNKVIDICTNDYSHDASYGDYVYSGTSRIYRMKKEKFDTIFSARLYNDWGYYNYEIDNEVVYSSTFETKGYRVPLFMDDSAKYDKDKYNMIYVSGKNTDKFDIVIGDTANCIREFNEGFELASKQKDE